MEDSLLEKVKIFLCNRDSKRKHCSICICYDQDKTFHHTFNLIREKIIDTDIPCSDIIHVLCLWIGVVKCQKLGFRIEENVKEIYLEFTDAGVELNKTKPLLNQKESFCKLS